jgi:outer membrane lipoprotein carrier protein
MRNARACFALIVGCFALAGPAAFAASDSTTTTLDKYFDGLTTLRASFTQRVKDARGKEVESSSGTLVVSRPGKFRWEIHPKAGGAGQLLVADGKNVWFFDRDLEQVTVRPVEPRKGEADFRRALFGFGKGNLQRMIIDDRLGQTATIELQSVARNAKVEPDEVSFTPPAGTDVIGKPVS